MIDELKIFRGLDYEINDKIKIRQPTLKEICDYGENEYWKLVFALTARPFDYKVQLDDIGFDYEEISDLDFFFLLTRELRPYQTKILLYDLDLSGFEACINKVNDETVYYNETQDIIIDANILYMITNYVRTVHNLPKKVDKAGNAHTKKFLIETERRKQNRDKNKPFTSTLIPSISALVNCEKFKYNHDTVWDLHIYAFNDSIKRIIKMKSVDNLYYGIYSGNIDSSSISDNDLNWLGSLDK